ncbi:MAG: heavy metal translocating P-type ATPase metal-binding domain-containing protein [Flavobacteriales bacterium]|nr:heavy metal translocating P-type ATPase metal-binding domain-containing protein [Flavobacteriales bacterium]MBL6872671.1 heavy metal translocating P-type ATPase metal-binding domain-containing protein [Flavobacteriales bacterium]
MKKPLKNCSHCGEITSKDIRIEEKYFCCEGCKVVYDILKDNNLTSYYNDNSGIIPKKIKVVNTTSFPKHQFQKN